MRGNYQHARALEYRRDIDGLRAVAVLSVVFFHLFPASLPGGFVGVDIFFCISGYLISRIIAHDLASDRFSFRAFYAHRVRRIFPAFAVCLFTSAILGGALLYSEELARFGKHMAAGAFFSSNFVLWSESGYFDNVAQRKPLLHLWSLSIEEQFYLLWPLFLYASYKLRLCISKAAALVGLISLALSVYVSLRDPSAGFYNPLVRAWELVLGSLVGFWAMRHGALSPRASALSSFLGVTLITISLCFFRPSLPFPSWWALVPTIGAVCVLAANPEVFINRILLSNRAAEFIGKISYPLYLFHWPLWSFSYIRMYGEVSDGQRWMIVFASFALSIFTYYVIERPIRRKSPDLRLVLSLGGIVFSLGCLGCLLWRFDGFARLSGGDTKAEYLREVQTLEQWLSHVRNGRCHLQDAHGTSFAEECVEKGRPLVLLWGDSHAGALYPGLAGLQKRRPFGLIQMTRAGCPPFLDSLSKFSGQCDTTNARLLAQIPKLDPDIILIHAAWVHHHYPQSTADIITKTKRTVEQIKLDSPRSVVVLIGPMPRWNPSLPTALREYIAVHVRRPPLYLPRIDNAEYQELVNLDSDMRGLARDLNVRYLSPEHIFCEKRECRTRLNDTKDGLFSPDDGHLSVTASKFFVNEVEAEIFR